MSALHAQGTGPTAEFKQRVNPWMVSVETVKRKAAYRAWLQLGPEWLPEYHKALSAAANYHTTKLNELAGARGVANPYAAHQEVANRLDGERLRVMALIKTDWHKDPSKVQMLRAEVAKVAELWSHANRLAAADTKRVDATLNASVGGMMEVARELERFDNAAATTAMDEPTLKSHLLKDQVKAGIMLQHRERFELTRHQATALATVDKANASLGQWATTPIKNFIVLLNRERAIMGLKPLRLEEHLATAARGHSEDMVRLNFFDHTSPVPGKSSPAERARLAGFTGPGTGENIYYATKATFNSAYQAWFGSDGHRFNMFGGEWNVAGVGVAGTHWTLMPGQTAG